LQIQCEKWNCFNTKFTHCLLFNLDQLWALKKRKKNWSLWSICFVVSQILENALFLQKEESLKKSLRQDYLQIFESFFYRVSITCEAFKPLNYTGNKWRSKVKGFINCRSSNFSPLVGARQGIIGQDDNFLAEKKLPKLDCLKLNQLISHTHKNILVINRYKDLRFFKFTSFRKSSKDFISIN